MKINKKNCPSTYYRHKNKLSSNFCKFRNRNSHNAVEIRQDKVFFSETDSEAQIERHVLGENIGVDLSPSNLSGSDVYSIDQSSTEIISSISNDIQQWALRYKVNHKAVTDLLQIICDKMKQNVPRDARTLLKTPRSILIDKIDSGYMWYHGIKNCLIQSTFAKCTQSIVIDVNFNMDGLPLHKSSKNEFWPILMNFARMPEIKPMIVAIYLGTSKPTSVTQFLSKFVAEFNDVCTNGVQMLSGTILRVKLNAFICDKPARAHIKCRFIVIYYSHI